FILPMCVLIWINRCFGRASEHGVDKGEDQPKDEATNMRPEGHTAAARTERGCAVEYLNDKPQAQHKIGRQSQRQHEEAEKWKADAHPRPRIQHNVCAEHSGNCTACPDQRHTHPVIQQRVRQRSSKPAEQIERQKTAAAQKVLDIGGEYPQEDHVADQMPGIAMQEHATKEIGKMGYKKLSTRQTARSRHLIKRL